MLKVKPTCQVLLIEKHVRVSMLGHLLLQLGNKIVMFVEELGVFLDFTLGFANLGEIIFVMAVVLDKRVILLVVNLEHDHGIRELG